MFTPAELEGMPEEIVRLFSQLEIDLMGDIVDRIAEIGEISRTADYEVSKLYDLGMSSYDIMHGIQDRLSLADEEIDRIYDSVIKEGYARDEDIYKLISKDFTPYEDNAGLQQLISGIKEQTKDEFRNITQSTGFRIKMGGKSIYTPIGEHYQRILDKSMAEILTGSFDCNKTLNNTVKQMINSGIRTVDYESGHTDRIEVAARRAVMTGINQVTARITEENAKKLDTDYFEVSWHATARPTHQEWQGRVYSKSELETVCGLGTITGLCGINCYHSYDPFIMGLSERSYADEELDQLNAAENTQREWRDKEYTSYQATQHQRKLERIMRAQRQEIKLLEKGNADEDDIIAAKCRYQSTSQEYAEFSKEMGLPQKRERVFMDGLGSIGAAKKRSYPTPPDNITDSASIHIGKVGLKDVDGAIRHYNKIIRNADIEHSYIIDRKGNVYYSKGDKQSVALPKIKLNDAIITHNHPRSNGISSFGKDDFEVLRDNQSLKKMVAVNEKYDYTVSVIKDIDNVSYNECYAKAMERINPFSSENDMNHEVFEVLKQEGYIDYERKAVNKGSGKTN